MILARFKNDTTEKDIQKVLMEIFGVENEAFESIKKGQTCGYVRFHERSEAINLVAKVNEKNISKMLKIKSAYVDFRILEGEEETVYLNHTLRVLKVQNNKKRGLDVAFDQSEINEHFAGMEHK